LAFYLSRPGLGHRNNVVTVTLRVTHLRDDWRGEQHTLTRVQHCRKCQSRGRTIILQSFIRLSFLAVAMKPVKHFVAVVIAAAKQHILLLCSILSHAKSAESCSIVSISEPSECARHLRNTSLQNTHSQNKIGAGRQVSVRN
jgi:hypothetical protein